MSPQSAFLKSRAVQIGTGSSNELLPPSKRAREIPPQPVGELRVGMVRTPSDDEKNLTALGTTPPDMQPLRLILRGKSPIDAEKTSGSRATPPLLTQPLPTQPLAIQPPPTTLIPTEEMFEIPQDSKSFACPICFNRLSLPVHQCKNGHMVCLPCKYGMEKAKRSCFCGESTWDIRNLGIELVLEQLTGRCCKHVVYGCKDTIGFLKVKEHEEELCKHRPYTCVVDRCIYIGPKPALLQHFDKQHQMQAVQIDRTSGMVQFTMTKTEKYKLVQSNQELYVVYHEPNTEGPAGDIFYFAAFGTYKRYFYLRVELRSEKRDQAMLSEVPEIKDLEEWKLKKEYIVLFEGINRREPRTNCEFHLEVSLAQPPV
ncbi:hypothetical protein KC19_2G208100 [Ceratodon purpureus]|uniref:RING-type E3 ubiquitin transferase n=1 Tax=Ceratodon purpureus TaxID=3225 RepID=A0A8T0IXT2_CERPU|nr:hypothetical protein KC19_2G208100 [Ceratodon purpureus]KAG0588005.1 hypothetical protein KC19_2G208100 [Ceratodon purpureus]KAG0588006.1 hypothetical protein KC19_2G208100 [Ceratodon purpureus]KAG0588007.1 hypothetical protein KC19_2G208100 [Ceratodon purpureus]